ncbi:hypothetical protein Syun_000225 [Stephania yunnanensis]|uniref:Protein CHUP1, chloroplastic n=1 Tax=Stephania yunnanensis TaxID=152371 RepID=A0AAP0Q5D0_9MAGN
MPINKEDLQITFLKSELESAAQRNCFLEKENEQLKQELAYLKAKICTLKAQSIERKSSLRKKLSNTAFDGGNESSLQQKQQIAHINSREDCPRVYEGSLSALDPLETKAKVEKLPQVVPVPPPAPTSAAPKTAALPIDYANEKTVPGPPAPPPLPSKLLPRSVSIVRRVPEVMEFYRTITKKHNKADNKNSFQGIIPASANARNMIGEIENRSTYLLAIKSDVETHGEHIRFLTREVENAAFTEISDMEAFVKWLDLELSYLVDERAVLKHFPQWPERKADAMREAAFSYRDLKSLEAEVLSFKDNPKQLAILSLKKMQALQDRLEGSIHNVQRMRDSVSQKYREFQIPWKWMLDAGVISHLKLSSLRLAKEYMRRVATELQSHCSKKEELMLQGVRFAFRVHQFAGGFDAEALRGFEELKAATLDQFGQQNSDHNLPKPC